MIHALMMAAARRRKGFNPFRYTGPGAKALIAGDAEKGYFGEVSSAELITGEALAAAVGLTAGTVQNSTTSWLKFMHGKRTLFVPKLTIRQGVSWDKLYSAGVVYGVEGPGQYIGSDNIPVNQNKILVIGGNAYIVRLLRGGDTNPASKIGGEVDDLLFRLWEHDPSGSFWTQQTAAAIGFSGNGQYSWVQESPGPSPSLVGGNRVWRIASLAPSLKDVLTSNMSSASTASFGWRPALELIPNDLFVFDLEGIQLDTITPVLLTVSNVSFDTSEAIFRINVVGYETLDQPLEVAGVDAALHEAVTRIQVASYTTEDILLPIGNVTTTIV